MRNMKKYLTCLIIMLFILPAGAVIAGSDSHTDTQAAPAARTITASDLVWPMFGKDKEHTFIATPTVKGIFTPAEKWGVDTQIDSLGAAIGNFAANIFGTYDRDVNFAVYAENGFLYIVDGSTGETAWLLDCDGIDSSNDNDMVFTSPAIGDLNKNGKMDVVFAVDDASNNSNVYVYEQVIQYTSKVYDLEDKNHTS